jgi:hypothetical protein
MEIVRLSPELFKGPDGKERREKAQLAWRRIHRVPDLPPPSMLELLERSFGDTPGKQARPGTRNKPRVYANSERDAWLYDRMKNYGRSAQEACNDLGDEGPRRGWSIVENRESVYQAVKKYAERNGIPPVSAPC